ncbi:MAG: tetratricopeptide repeat protein [Candidatus Eisenbacteria bacterium]|nr:tetratricopeptide repeat protein [Candidatus Eisenbacteria bacterium]
MAKRTGPLRGLLPEIVLYGIAFAAQALYIITIRNEPTFRAPVVDGGVYVAAAESILRGEGIGPGPFRFGPLYPYMLALWLRLAGGSLLGAHLLQALWTALTAPLLHRLGRALLGRTAGLVAGFAAAFYWPLIYFAGEPLIEPVLLPILLVSLLLLLRMERKGGGWTVFAAGAALGLSAIARPNALFPAGVFILREALRRRPARAAILLAGVLLPVLPVTVRNVVAGGDAVLISSTAGINFYIGNNERSGGRDSSFPGMVQWTFDKVHRLAEIETGHAMKPSAVSRHYLRKGLAWAALEPGRFLLLQGRKAVALLSSYEMPNVKDPLFYRDRSPFLRLPLFLGFGAAAPLALLGLLRRRRRPGEGTALLFFGAWTFSALLFFVNARYRLPLVPFFLLYGAMGATRLAGAMRADRRRAAALIAALIAAFFLVNWNPLGRVDDPSQAWFNEAWARQQTGDREGALEGYDRVNPGSAWYPLALNNRAVLFLREASVDKALRDLVRAVEIDSTYYDAWSNLGRVYYNAGRPDEAALAFGRAARLRPDDPAHHANLGLARKGTGDLEGAAEAFRGALRADDGYGKAREHLAETLVILGANDEARAELERILRDDPRNATAWYHLGTVRRRSGDDAGAREAWRTVIRLEPDGRLAPLARAALGE